MDWGGCPVCVKNGIYLPPEREIRLADVLIALKECNHKISDRFLVESNGEFHYFDKMTGHFAETVINWNLKNNDLNNQSKPTIDFLHKLLCKNNS